MTDKAPREFWIRWHDHFSARNHVITDVMTVRIYNEDIHVIEKSAYDRAMAAIEMARHGLRCRCCPPMDTCDLCMALNQMDKILKGDV